MINNENRKSFTLIELLVVLALVAILSVVVVMTLNPAELIKQARDSNRLSDLSTINTALNLFSTDVTSGFMGTSTVVYVSIPDNASSTCGSLGLPTLPAGYIYNCVTSANLRNTNGTGWIPVNFQRISSNSSISQLPIDPQNTTSTKYYTYVTGGSWKVIATPESQKYLVTAGTDGGSNIGQFEVGNNMSLAPFKDGLIGWWDFEEGPSSTSTDRSGYGNNGTWNGTSTSRYVAGKVGQFAGYFNGSSDYFATNLGVSSSSLINGGLTIANWVKVNTIGTVVMFVSNGWNYSSINGSNTPVVSCRIDALQKAATGASALSVGEWYLMVNVSDNNGIRVYINGIQSGTTSYPGVNNPVSGGFRVGAYVTGTMYFTNGYLDDVRIYNRALSASEVLALYNSTR